MSVVIISQGLASGAECGTRGLMLKTYDPEFAAGRGDAEWTADPAEALKFGSVAEAVRFWRQVPESRPVREDGRPNRPLTAFTITFASVSP